MSLATRPVRFGALLRQADNRWERIAESARICDDLGCHEPEYHAYGFEFPPPGVRVAQLAEAVRLIKRLWTGEPVDFEGRYYRVRGGRCRRRPHQSPRPPIVIGGAGEKRMLRPVAQEADVWNCSAGNYAQLDHKVAVLREHCRAVGRGPAG